MNEKNKERKRIALKMKMEGHTYQDISVALGVSRSYAQQLVSPHHSIRTMILRRAKEKCESCGILVGRGGHIHHKANGDEDYNDIENLELLCPTCHSETHGILRKNLAGAARTVDRSGAGQPAIGPHEGRGRQPIS